MIAPRLPFVSSSISRRRLPGLLLLLGALLAFSCLGGRPPQTPASRTLEIGSGDTDAAKAAKAFAVVFGGPKAEAPSGAVVSIVFNRPMRALELAGDERTVPATILAADGSVPKGEWRWLGTNAVMFAPHVALPRASEFTVNVPAGTRALDGSSLAKAYTFSFSTERPALVRTVPSDGTEGFGPKQTFDLYFNQPVSLKSAESSIKMLASGDALRGSKTSPPGRPLGFTLSYAKKDVLTHLKLVPTQPLPLDSRIQIIQNESLRGTEGTLPPRDAKEISTRTYGPITVKEISCSRPKPDAPCEPGGGVHVSLSNPVSAKEFRAHVRVEPAREIKWSKDDPNESSNWHAIPIGLRAASSLRVTITRGMVDAHGQAMKQDSSAGLSVGDEPPSLRVGLRGMAFETSATDREIPVLTINQPSYDLLAAPLDEVGVSRLLSVGGAKRWELANGIAPGKVQTIRPNAPKNSAFTKRVPLEGTFGVRPAVGAMVFGTRFSTTGRVDETDVRLLSVSDLAISAKLSRFGSLVWVTKLSDGKPVKDAVVSARNGEGIEVAKATTDKDGICTFTKEQLMPISEHGASENHMVLFARSGADWTFRAADDVLEPWRIQPSSDPSGGLRTYGMLFTDRGIYRTGESVRLKGLFRTPLPKGTATPKGKVVTVAASDTEGNQFFNQKATLGAFGEFSLDVVLPETIHLGRMDLSASLDDETNPKKWAPVAARTEVEIAAYRAAEFKVGVETHRTSYVRGDKAEYAVRGDYLFGAPMNAGKGRVTVNRSRSYFSPEKTEGFATDDETYLSDIPNTQPNATSLDNREISLDSKGTFNGSVALTMPNQTGAETLSVEAEVQDLSRQTVASQSSVIVHPGEFYVGVKTSGDMFVAAGSDVKAEALAVEPNGARRTGVEIGVDLVKRSWNTSVEASGIEGDEAGAHYRSRVDDKIVAHCDIVSGPNAVACNLAPKDAGYYVVRATAKDGRGNSVSSSVPLYATGSGASFGWADNDSSRLDLTTDKKTYEIGDTARILVKSPFQEADALVTVERAGVYTRERTHLRGSMSTISVNITDDIRPNAFVSVELVKGRSAPVPQKGFDVGTPQFRIGYAQLVVNPESRRLNVSLLSSKKDYRPGEEVDCDIRVLDRKGAGVSAGVTFYAVDEGVLMLTGYKTPDPIPVFSARRPLAVLSLESRSDLARLLRLSNHPGEDKGGEGGGGGSAEMGTRQDFRATAYFNPDVVTGKDGKAHVHFKLPDNLTTFRLMAVAAAEDDRFGFSESRIVTSRPLMARPALPRFLRSGDSIEASMIVSAKGLRTKDVEVALELSGAKLLGPSTRKVAIPESGSLEVRWPVAIESPGKVAFAFRAKSGAETDVVKIVRDASVPTSPEAVAFYGETTGSVAEQIGSLAAVRPDFGGLDLRLSSSALVGLDDGVESLVTYPYGCTEQITSRLVPLVAITDLAKEYGIKLPPNAREIAQKSLGELMDRQHGNGGFGYWPDSTLTDTWVTAYALWGLSLGKAAEYDVSEATLKSGTTFVRRELMARLKSQKPLDLATAAFILDVLAMRGAPDAGYMTRLFEERAKLPLFARALLAHAFAVSKSQPNDAQELIRDVENHLHVTPTGAIVTSNHGNEYAQILDSDARTTAIVLRALVAVDQGHPLASRLAKGLLGLRKGGSWRNTQETAWSLVALNDYRRAQEKVAPDFDAKVFFGDNAIFDASFKEQTVTAKSASFGMAKLFATDVSKSAFEFQVEGRGKLFYEARLRYTRKALPTTPLDRGFYVQKFVRNVARPDLPQALKSVPSTTTSSAKPGELVLVDLVVVSSEPREQVVVDDPLAAGLEAVQANLATVSSDLAVDRPDDERTEDEAANGMGFSEAWFHREYHDDRVLTFVEHMPAGMFHYRYLARATTLGSFVVPPTRVECMYEPEVFGRTPAGALEVR